ncbi:MAG: TonB-dependent receptor [Sphingomonadales bacterium]
MTKLIHKPLMVKKAALLASAAASAVCISSPAAAQDDGFGLEEILVTAQRRAQSIQDVPIAISAFDEEQLRIRNIDSALDLTDYIPNLFGSNNTGLGSANAYYIRGLGNTESIATFDPPVGTYIDDIYISRQNANNFSFFDLDRIEVLRGPQGTLFGRNTTGGAINVLLREPGEEFGGFAEVSYGRFERVTARGSVDIPITDTLSTKVSAYFVDDDGYAYSFELDENINDERSYGLRGALKWTPNELVNWNVSATYVDSDYANVANSPVDGDNVFDSDLPGAASVNATTLARFEASGATTDLPRVSGAFISTQGGVGNTLGGLLSGQGMGNVAESLLLVSNLELDFDEVNIEIITGWFDLNQDFTLPFFDGELYTAPIFGDTDGDGIPALTPAAVFGNPGPSTFSIANRGVHKQFSQEIKANGQLFDGLIDYVAGVYFLSERNQTDFAQFFLTPQYDRMLENDTNTGAGYVQLDWNITEKLILTTGIRYTDETKEIDVMHTATSAFTFTTTDLIAAGITRSQNVSILTPRFAVQYEVNDDVLVFASATRGFKSGGWNARGTTAETLLNFDPEKVWSYEIGTKSQFFDDRLRINATAFFNDVADFQVPSAFETEEGGLEFITQNFADMEVYGIELETTFVVNQFVTLTGSLGWQDASYNNVNPSVAEQQQRCQSNLQMMGVSQIFGADSGCEQGIVRPDGDISDPVRSPGVTAVLGGNVNYPITDNFQIVANAFAIHTGSYDTATSGNPEGFQDAFWRFNGNIGIEQSDGDYGLYLECQNCFGENWVQSSLAGVQYFNQPSNWTLRALYRF